MVGAGLLMYARSIPSNDGESLLRPAILLPVLAYLAFGVAFWVATRRLDKPREGRWGRMLLMLGMTLTAIAVSTFTGSGLGALLMMVMAAVVPWLLPVGLGAGWLVAQHVALVPIFMTLPDFGLVEAIMQSALYIGTSGFVFVTGLVARRQAEAREEQRRLNAELRATRALLAENTRVAERLRISRELHDLLGHHLTALSLNLEVAGHLTEGKPQEHVRQAHTLAKLLLTDVREAVSTMREDDALDLGTALRALVDGLPGLEVRLQLDQPLTVDDPDVAHVLVRCVQEIITNTVRHARASRLDIAVGRVAQGLRVVAEDDGVGADALTPGNGLSGLRERVASVGGKVHVTTAPGQGFRTDIQFPMERTA
jgi:signal transduction histidine kinase